MCALGMRVLHDMLLGTSQASYHAYSIMCAEESQRHIHPYQKKWMALELSCLWAWCQFLQFKLKMLMYNFVKNFFS